MVDPIISTGLAKNWLERLLKSWSVLRKTREDELQEIRNVFGDPELLADYYIEPDCQPVNPADHDEDEAIRAFRQPVRFWLNRFLEGEFLERDGRNTVFILSDAGMEKTSLLMMLKLTHLSRFWPDGLDFRLMKLGPDTLEKLAKIQDHARAVLLLDSLDEDPSAWGRIEERLTELLDATKSFRQVILTCRTQFFPEGSAAPIEVPYKVVVGGYICNLLYLSPFDNQQVEAYLRNVYPNRWRDLLRKWWTKEDNPNLVKARKAVEPMKSLRLRPMLLAHIEELLQAGLQEMGEFPVYAALVRHWLMREQRKQRGKYTEAQLWEVCEEVAIFLQVSGKRVLSLEDLEEIRRTLPAAETLETFDIGGRSLLNRTSDKGFRFSHYSIQEFLVARRLVLDRWRKDAPLVRGTDQLVSFIFSWIEQSFIDRMLGIDWVGLDLADVRFKINRAYVFTEDFSGARLRGVYLRGARISGCLQGADLRGAWLEDCLLDRLDLQGADLRRAHLRGAVLDGVNLRMVDAREADFSGCSFRGSELSYGRFARSKCGRTTFERTSLHGAGFLSAEGIPDSLVFDEATGPSCPRYLRPAAIFPEGNVGKRKQKVVESGLKSPRVLSWLARHGLLSVGREICLWSSAGRRSTKRSAAIEIRSLVCSHEEDFLFALDSEGSFERWDLKALQLRAVSKRFGLGLIVGCSKEDVFFAWPSGRCIRVLRYDGEKEISLEGHVDPVNCVSWRPRSAMLASASYKTVRLWDVEHRGGAEILYNSPKPLVSLAWEPTGAFLSGIMNNRSICIWDVERKELLPVQDGLPPVAALVWAPKEFRVALLGCSGEVVLWDVLDKSQVMLPVLASAVAWHPHGTLLALVTQQGAIEIWEVSGDSPQLRLSLFETQPVNHLVITADGYVDGPPEALQYVRFADGEALYDLDDLPERHDPERVRQAMAILSP